MVKNYTFRINKAVWRLFSCISLYIAVSLSLPLPIYLYIVFFLSLLFYLPVTPFRLHRKSTDSVNLRSEIFVFLAKIFVKIESK